MSQGVNQGDVMQAMSLRRLWLLPIPQGLLSDYSLQRQAAFGRLVRLWSPLLPLAFVVCMIFTVQFYKQVLLAGDLRVFAVSESLIAFLCMVGLVLARCARWRRHFDVWVPVFVGLVLAIKVFAGHALANEALANNQVYVTMLVLFIGVLGLQLQLRAAATGCLIGSMGFLGLLWGNQTQFGLMFLGNYILSAGVALFVCALVEDKDRMAFLQSMQLAKERQQVLCLNEELAALVRRDALTGLGNRRRFDEALEVEWGRAQRTQSPLSLLLIDIDHFKHYNDDFGHPAGDQCLRRVADVIAGVAKRPTDVSARYGGEEFAMLLPATDADGACELARNLIVAVDACRLPHGSAAGQAHVTVSVGVATLVPSAHVAPNDLIQAADVALYEAKSAGRHTFRLLDGLPLTAVMSSCVKPA